MRVAVVIDRYDAAGGGAERSVFELVDALEKLGLEVEVIAAAGQSQAKNVRILCAEGGKTSWAEYSQALERYIAGNRYDIVHSTLPLAAADVYQPRGGTYPETIIRNAASYGNRLVTWAKLATSSLNLKRGELFRAEQALCKAHKGPVIAALSQYVAEQFKAHYSVPEARIVVIPGGIKTESGVDRETVDRVRGQILVQLGIQEATNPALFLFAAHNFRLKGLGPLIHATAIASRFPNERPPFLVVAGGDNAAWYKLLAAKAGIYGRVLFAGRIKHMQAMLAACDAAVLPTFYDPCSRFILEALAAGKPVITTSYNGASERYESGRHGLTIERPDDVPELAKALCHYCTEENVRKAALAVQRDGLAADLSVDRHAGRLVELYRQILERRGR